MLVSAFNGHRAAAGVVLEGGGATFPYPLYAKWFAAFSEIDKGVDFDCQRVGSGEGQRLIANQFIDFGASDAVAAYVKNTPGAIGFVELLYAIQNQLSYASIKNAGGNYIQASPDSITAALRARPFPMTFVFPWSMHQGLIPIQSQV